MLHELCKSSARSAWRIGGPFGKKLMRGCINPLPLHGPGLKSPFVRSISWLNVINSSQNMETSKTWYKIIHFPLTASSLQHGDAVRCLRERRSHQSWWQDPGTCYPALVEYDHRLAGSEVLVLRLLPTLALLRVVVYHWWQIEMNDYRKINAGKWDSGTWAGSVFKTRSTYHVNMSFCNSVWSINKTIWTLTTSRIRNPGARDISDVQIVLLIDQTLLQKES